MIKALSLFALGTIIPMLIFITTPNDLSYLCNTLIFGVIAPATCYFPFKKGIVHIHRLTPSTPLQTKITNEQIKLLATLLNNLSFFMIASSILQPFLSVFVVASINFPSLWASVVFVVFFFLLQFLTHSLLGSLKEEIPLK